jgi:hypothetical protein
MESLLQAGLQRAEERAADEGGIVENVERELQAVHGTSAPGDLETGAEHQLTNLAADFDVRDFAISPDGRHRNGASARTCRYRAARGAAAMNCRPAKAPELARRGLLDRFGDHLQMWMK